MKLHLRFKNLFVSDIKDFKYFYSFLGHRLILAMGLSLLVGVLDGFGLSMFLPLLQMAGDNGQTAVEIGKLQFLIDGMVNLGIPLSLVSILCFNADGGVLGTS